MANKIFSSYSSSKNRDVANDRLIVEAGTRHLACLVKAGSKQVIRDFELYKVETEGSVDYQAFFNNCLSDSSILANSFSEINLIINNEYSVIIPSESAYNNSGVDYLNLLYGDNFRGPVYKDAVNGTDMINVYRIPSELITEIGNHLRGNSITHSYSKIISNVVSEAHSNNLLKVLFYENAIVVVLMKDGKLNLIQTFTFQSPEDVLYYLLSIAQRFHLHTDQTLLEVSGMFDSSSSLLHELRKFYKNVNVEDSDSSLAQMSFGDFPKHYFTPFINLAK
jgi:hypothetical protein